MITIYFISKGITITQVVLAVCASTVVSLLCDIPAGAVIDRSSKRVIFGIAALFHALGYLLWAVEANFLMAVIGYAVWGAGRAFYPGY